MKSSTMYNNTTRNILAGVSNVAAAVTCIGLGRDLVIRTFVFVHHFEDIGGKARLYFQRT